MDKPSSLPWLRTTSLPSYLNATYTLTRNIMDKKLKDLEEFYELASSAS
jgi:hypothetical protein